MLIVKAVLRNELTFINDEQKHKQVKLYSIKIVGKFSKNYSSSAKKKRTELHRHEDNGHKLPFDHV